MGLSVMDWLDYILIVLATVIGLTLGTPSTANANNDWWEGFSENQPREKTTVIITWKREYPQDFDARGKAYWKGDTCTIVAPEPKDMNDHRRLNTLGHEMMHCFNGQVHKRR